MCLIKAHCQSQSHFLFLIWSHNIYLNNWICFVLQRWHLNQIYLKIGELTRINFLKKSAQIKLIWQKLCEKQRIQNGISATFSTKNVSQNGASIFLFCNSLILRAFPRGIANYNQESADLYFNLLVSQSWRKTQHFNASENASFQYKNCHNIQSSPKRMTKILSLIVQKVACNDKSDYLTTQNVRVNWT